MKKLIIGFFILFVVLPRIVLAADDLERGLILHYTLDTNSGSSVADTSGQGHPGVVNGATFTPEGRWGGAYYFNGINNYILAGNLGYHPTGTISFWMKAEALENWRNPLTTAFADWDACIRFEESSDGIFTGGGLGLGGSGGWYTHALVALRWYHVVYAWDALYVYGYLDGALMFKAPHPNAASRVHPNLPLTAGQYKQMALNLRNVAIGNGYSMEQGRFWKGWIDDVRIYDRAISNNEVLRLYRYNDNALVLYYPFDTAPQNGVVADQSGLGNNAVVHGGVAYRAVDGKWKGALEFNGTDGFLFVKKSAPLDVGNALTFAVWYKAYDRTALPPSNRQNPILEYSNGTLAGAHMWADVIGYQWNGQGTGANLVDTRRDEVTHVISIADQAKNEWHHLAVTYDGKAGIGRVFIDGVQTQERQMGSFTPQTDFDLYIGKRPKDQPSFSGLLDEVRIYNRPLTPQEIRALYDTYTLGKVYQNFESNNGTPAPAGNPLTPEYGWPINGAQTALDTTARHNGARSWKVAFSDGWGGTGIPSQTETYNFKAEPQRHDRLTFWVLAKPNTVNAKTTVRVRLFDKGSGVYQTDGFEISATQKANYNQWTQVSILFTQLPSGFNLNNVDKLQFVFVNDRDTAPLPGTYYLDDIQIESQDRTYQDFESWSCPGGDCGWAWNGTTSVAVDQVYNGLQSWKLIGNWTWNGTGIKSQEKRCSSPVNICSYQDPWSVDMIANHLMPSTAEHLTFWLKPLSSNGMSSNIELKLFDHANYRDGTSGAGIWTAKSGTYNEWTRLSVPLTSIKAAFPTLNLSDINKLELGSYWPGTYYFDDIRVTRGQEIRIANEGLSSGQVSWAPVVGAAVYTLQESTTGPTGRWRNIYTGADTVFSIAHLAPSWLRVRWETATDPAGKLVPYYSDWSDAAFYKPRPVLLSSQLLRQYGYLDWSHIPQAQTYLLQQGASKIGPWVKVYEGGYRVPPPLCALVGKWYRVRGQVVDTRGKVVEYSPWSPALLFDPSNFIRASKKVLRDRNGAGSVVTLRGFNLGNYLLLEYWMTGLSWTLERQAFTDAGLNYDVIVPALIAKGYAVTGADGNVRVRHPFTGLNNDFRAMFPGLTPQQFTQIETLMEPDDWRIRQALGSRAASVMQTYQNAYIQDIDLDNIMDTGANFIRLPIYYRDIRDINDQTGQWINGSTFNFSTLDRIVNLCADRGIAVLLDLHGAPGAQSDQFHTGRTGYNKLFAPDALGVEYRARTKELWLEIARHYRFNTAVMGFDLLNEPVGFTAYSSGYTALWSLYNELYHVIRDANKASDNDHVIVMEGAWNWDSLPSPTTYKWQNVMYQFHYYCWGPAEGQKAVLGEQCPAEPPQDQITYQKAYIDTHLAASRQAAYNVPVMIGEFNGFGQKEVWQYYLQKFNQYGYSWSIWSYKNHDHATSWGIYDHLLYDEALPDFQYDTPKDLNKKLDKYDTLGHHIQNKSLINIIKNYM